MASVVPAGDPDSSARSSQPGKARAVARRTARAEVQHACGRPEEPRSDPGDSAKAAFPFDGADLDSRVIVVRTVMAPSTRAGWALNI